MELLGADFIRRFAGRIVNVHPSLLPSFPGVGAIEQALAHGVKTTGVTVHFVDEGIDSGPIVLQEALELSYPARIAEIEEQVHAIEHRLLPRAVAADQRGPGAARSREPPGRAHRRCRLSRAGPRSPRPARCGCGGRC